MLGVCMGSYNLQQGGPTSGSSLARAARRQEGASGAITTALVQVDHVQCALHADGSVCGLDENPRTGWVEHLDALELAQRHMVFICALGFRWLAEPLEFASTVVASTELADVLVCAFAEVAEQTRTSCGGHPALSSICRCAASDTSSAYAYLMRGRSVGSLSRHHGLWNASSQQAEQTGIVRRVNESKDV